MVKINGEFFDVSGKTLAEYIEEKKYNAQRLAVERNGEIVKKDMYDKVILKDDDSIEIVSFVGGG